MEADETIRERIRNAREELKLSQTDLARLLDISQASMSDIERGRVQITANQLARCAKFLKKPVEYFFPGELTATDKPNSESELLESYRMLPDKWQNRALYEMKQLLRVYEDIKPYEQAGIPEEYYEKLMWYLDDRQKTIDYHESGAAEGEPSSSEDYQIKMKKELEFSKRFHVWLEETDKRIQD